MDTMNEVRPLPHVEAQDPQTPVCRHLQHDNATEEQCAKPRLHVDREPRVMRRIEEGFVKWTPCLQDL